MPARGSRPFQPAHRPWLARAIVLATVALVFLLIGGAAWLADAHGYRGARSWLVLAPVAVVCVVLGFVGAFAAERVGRAPRDGPSVAWRAALAARQRALETDPDPRRRRYAVFLARGIDLAEREIERRERRLREIEGDPAKARYAERIFNGETITDEAIAYWEDPLARVTCTHLAAIEGDLRAADPALRPGGGPVVFTGLDFDLDALRRRYRPDPCVELQAGHWDDRGPSNDPQLRCRACNAAIVGGFGARFPAG